MGWFVFLLFLELGSPSAFAAREDSAAASTTAGGGFGFGLLQTISVNRHFFKTDELDETPEVKHEMDAQEEAELLRRREAYPLAYHLGYAYDLTATGSTKTDQSMVDQAHTFVAGLDSELSPVWNFTARALVTSVPDENLKQGTVFLRTDYLFNFAKKKRRGRRLRSKDLKNASIYYRQFLDQYGINRRGPIGADEQFDEADPEDRLDARTRQQIEEDRREAEAAKRAFHEDQSKDYVDDVDEEDGAKNVDPDEVFPNLRVGLQFGYYRRTRESFTGSRTTRPVSNPADMTLDSGSLQPEIVFSPNESWAFRAAATFYHYAQSADDFASLLEQSAAIRQSGQALPGLAGTLSQSLAMASTAFDVTGTWYANDQWTAELAANYTQFQLAKTGDAISFMPALYRAVGRHWNVGGGVEVSIGDAFVVSGMAGVTYFF